MISIGDAMMKMGVDKGQFEADVTSARQHVQTNMQSIQKALGVAGGAFLALGVAGLKITSDFRKLNAELGQTGITLGISAKEMRNLALETTNVTFPLKSVAATFDILVRAGMRNTDEMQKAALAFDALADATGSSAERIADMLIPMYRALGEEIPKTTAELDKFTWLAKNTLVDLEDLGGVMRYVAAYGQDLKMTTDDLVAVMAVLSERGIQGSAATMMFRRAITQANSTGQDLFEILNVTQDELENFNKQMEGAKGLTEEYAEAANEQYTALDRLKQRWSEFTLSIGEALVPLEGVMAAMTAMGPMMISTAMILPKLIGLFKGLTIAKVGVKIAAIKMWAAVTLGISAVITGIVALIHNWHKVEDAFRRGWQNIRLFFLRGVQAVLGFLERMLGWLPGLGKAIKKAKEEIDAMVEEAALVKAANDAIRASANLVKAIEAEQEALKEKHQEELASIDQIYGQYAEIARFKRQQAEEAHRAERQELQERLDMAKEAHAALLRGEEGYTEDVLAELNHRIAERRKALEQQEKDALDFHDREKEFLLEYYGVYEEYSKDIEEARKQASQRALDYRLELLAMEGAAVAEFTDDYLEEVRKQMDADRRAYAESIGLIDFQIDYRENLLDSARRATEERLKQIDVELSAERAAYNERMRMIDEEYNARMRAIDATADAQIRELQRQIDELRKVDREEDRLREQAADEEKQRQLEMAVEYAQSELQKMRATEELNKFLEELAAKRAKQERELQIDALRDQITAVRDGAAAARDSARVERDTQVRMEEEKLAATLSRLEDERSALDEALSEELERLERERRESERIAGERLDHTLDRLDEERIALDAHLADEMKQIDDHVKAVNQHIAETLQRRYDVSIYAGTSYAGGAGGDRDVTYPEWHSCYTPPGGHKQPEPTPQPGGGGGDFAPPLQLLQHGGIIPEPTLLTSLRTGRPWGIAGEAGPEMVSPMGRRADIRIYLDGRVIAEAIGEPLMENIRIKTGVRF